MILSLIFTLSICGMSLASQEDSILIQKSQITDLSNLWERASKGISDDDSIKVRNELDGANVDKFIVDKRSTTQLLKKVKKNDGIIESEYVTTYFTTIYEPKKAASSLSNILFRIADSRNWDERDSSMSARQIATYYYLKYSDGNLTWIKPQKIECKWDTSNLVAVSNGKYGAEWRGESNFSGAGWVSSSDYNNVPSITLGTLYTNTINTIPNSGYINCSTGGGYVAFVQQCKCTKGSSSWTFKSDAVWQDI